jgi:NADH dehydrogenase
MHRTYHVSRIPSFNRKVRVVADWTLAFLFKRETISLGQLHRPRTEFTDVTPPLTTETPVGAGIR